MNILKPIIVAIAVFIFAGCSRDAAPLTEAQKSNIPEMRELMKKCKQDPPREGTQAKANCSVAQARVFLAPITREQIAAGMKKD